MKSRIISLNNGVTILGYRVFYYHKLLRKSNLRKFQRKISVKIDLVQNNILSYDSLLDSIQGWLGYAMWANTYKLRANIVKIIDHSLKIKNNKALII